MKGFTCVKSPSLLNPILLPSTYLLQLTDFLLKLLKFKKNE